MGAYLGLYWVLLIWQVGFLYFANFYFETNLNSSIYIGHSGLLVLQSIWEKNPFPSHHKLAIEQRVTSMFLQPLLKAIAVNCFRVYLFENYFENHWRGYGATWNHDKWDCALPPILHQNGTSREGEMSCHTKYLTRPMLHAQEHNFTKYIPKEH